MALGVHNCRKMYAPCTVCMADTVIGDSTDGTPLCDVACQARHYDYIGLGNSLAWPAFAAAWAKLQLTGSKRQHTFHVQRHVLSMVHAVLTGQNRIRKQFLREWAELFPARFRDGIVVALTEHVQSELQFIQTANVRGASEPDKKSKRIIWVFQQIPHTGSDFAIEQPWVNHMSLMHEWIYEHLQRGAQVTADWQRALAQGAVLGRAMDLFFKK